MARKDKMVIENSAVTAYIRAARRIAAGGYVDNLLDLAKKLDDVPGTYSRGWFNFVGAVTDQNNISLASIAPVPEEVQRHYNDTRRQREGIISQMLRKYSHVPA